MSFDNFIATITCSDFPACFPWHFVSLIALVTLSGQTGSSQVTRYTRICMSHRRRRRSGMVLFCMNRASAMGCLSLRMCSPYRLFVLYHRSITAFAKVIQALPPLNTPARECGYSRRSFGFTVVATCILALLLDFVNQFRYCGLLHSSWFKLIVAHAITMQDFHPQDISIPWHT